MAVSMKKLTASELKDLRAWRVFVYQTRGVMCALDDFEFTLGLPIADALAAYGMGRVEWAPAYWRAIRESFDSPVEAPAQPDAAQLDAAA